MQKRMIKDYTYITAGSLMIAVGIYFFVFPNNFCFGGIAGLVVIIAKFISISPSVMNLILSIILLLFGFAFLGRNFGAKTIYSSLLISLLLFSFDHICPMKKPLTNEPMLEFAFAIALPSLGSAILFSLDSSSGGTDIIAMILKKYTSINIGRALFLSDFIIVLSTYFVFDIRTSLFSFLGLFTKSILVNNAIEDINLSKYFNIICSNPEIICDFIIHELHRSATVCNAKGAFAHQNNFVILTAMKRTQALRLQKYIKQAEPEAFILISNTSEIVGRGF